MVAAEIDLIKTNNYLTLLAFNARTFKVVSLLSLKRMMHYYVFHPKLPDSQHLGGVYRKRQTQTQIKSQEAIATVCLDHYNNVVWQRDPQIRSQVVKSHCGSAIFLLCSHSSTLVRFPQLLGKRTALFIWQLPGFENFQVCFENWFVFTQCLGQGLGRAGGYNYFRLYPTIDWLRKLVDILVLLPNPFPFAFFSNMQVTRDYYCPIAQKRI